MPPSCSPGAFKRRAPRSPSTSRSPRASPSIPSNRAAMTDSVSGGVIGRRSRLYRLPASSTDPALASSELCCNRNAAKVTDILWLHANQRGCCLRPLQTLHITPWISFPPAPSLLPFSYAADTLTPASTPTEADVPRQQRVSLSAQGEERMQLLLEADIEPLQRPSSEDTSAVRVS